MYGQWYTHKCVWKAQYTDSKGILVEGHEQVLESHKLFLRKMMFLHFPNAPTKKDTGQGTNLSAKVMCEK